MAPSLAACMVTLERPHGPLTPALYLGARRYRNKPKAPKSTLGVQAATAGGIPAWVAETDMSLALKT